MPKNIPDFADVPAVVAGGGRKTPSVFCMILTTEKSLHTRAQLIYDIWGHKCHNYRFIGTIPKSYLSAEQLKDFDPAVRSYEVKVNNTYWLLQPAGLVNDTYKKLTDKIFWSLMHIQKAFPDSDWYLKSDDDTMMFIDNMNEFLSDKDPKSPVTYGYDFKVSHGSKTIGWFYLTGLCRLREQNCTFNVVQ